MDYFGLIAGILAKWIMPGKDGGGFFMTILLGIVGAVVGGWISTLFGFGKVDGFNFGSFVVAVIGAIVVLLSTGRLKLTLKLHKGCTQAAFAILEVTLPPSQLSAEYDNNRHTHHNNRCFSSLCSRGSIAANKTMLKYDRCNEDYNRKNNTDSHVITNQKDVNTPQECSAGCATKGVFCLCFFS